MPHERVIRHRRVEADPWKYVGVADAAELEGALPEVPVVVPLAYWNEHRLRLRGRIAPAGVWLKPDDDPAALVPDLEALPLIAVHFPKFTDGRGFSTASLLRKRYGYRGELRAFGDVGRDQLFYLARVGFDSFRLADHRDPEKALASFNDFRLRYQGAVDDPVPLFRKRGSGETAHG